jgi:hypothetical protein
MSKFAPMTGGCLCGAVHYSIAVEPLFGGRCLLPRLPAREQHRARGTHGDSGQHARHHE